MSDAVATPAAAPAKPVEPVKTDAAQPAAPATAAPAEVAAKPESAQPVTQAKDAPPETAAPNLLEAAVAAAAQDTEIKPPEGMQVDPKVLEVFKQTAKEQGLTPKQAQAVFDRYAALQKQAIDAHAEQARGAQNRQWESLQKDPEFGGANLDASKVAIQKALVRFGTPELNKELAALGNNPALLKVLARVGKTISEARTVHPPSGPQDAAQRSELDQLKTRYPTMFSPAEAE